MGAVNALHDSANTPEGQDGLYLSAELQRLADTISKDPLYNLAFSVTIADPKLPDCPLIACSIGFSELTGYSVQEIVGRSCRFLLDGVPPELICQDTRMKARSYCSSMGCDDEDNEWKKSHNGELICVQANARKTGELFRNMFYLREVEIDDTPLIIGLQAGLSDEQSQEIPELQKFCQSAYDKLNSNMSILEKELAAQFWYSAPMRRCFL
jgi:hypothetical protein